MSKIQLFFGWLFTLFGGGVGIANYCELIQPIIGVVASIVAITTGIYMLSLYRLRKKKLKLEIQQLQQQ